MKVTTSAPVYVNKDKVANGDLYMNAGGDDKKKGRGRNFLKKAGEVGRDSGMFDYLLNKAGARGQDSSMQSNVPPPPLPEPEKKGMSKGVKITLWVVGGLAVLGLGYWMLKKKK